MFGTVARMQVQEGKFDEFVALMENEEPDMAEGYVSTVMYRSTNDPNELWLSVIFSDEESYRANAAAPSQNQMYERMRALLAADPEWHDGEVIFASEGVGAPA